MEGMTLVLTVLRYKQGDLGRDWRGRLACGLVIDEAELKCNWAVALAAGLDALVTMWSCFVALDFPDST